MSDIKKFNNDMLADEGVILAKYKGKYIRSNDPQSILIPAPQGTGKTAGLIIPSLFSYTGSAVINDVKGELWNITSRQRSHFSKVRLFAPTLRLDNEATVSWNPFHEKCLPSARTWNPFTEASFPANKKEIPSYIKLNLETVLFSKDEAEKELIKSIVMLFVEREKELLTETLLRILSVNNFEDITKEIYLLLDIEVTLSEPERWSECSKTIQERFNAFFEEKCIDYIERISSVLYPTQSLQGVEKHFMSEARILFNFLAVATAAIDKTTSIPTIGDKAMESDDLQMVIAELMDEVKKHCLVDGAVDRYIRNLGNALRQKEGAEFASVKGSFRQAMDSFTSAITRRSLIDCDFTYADFRQKEAFSLYIYIPPAEIEKMAPVIRMLTEYLVNEFLSHPWRKDIQPHQVVFFEDEFPRIGRMDCIKNMPTLSRSFGVKAILQQNEEKTAIAMCGLIGDETRKKVSESKSKLLSKGDGSRSISKEGFKIITPQMLLNLPKDKIIILAKGHHARPIMADVCWWFKDNNMKMLAGAAYNLNLYEKYD